MENKEKIQSLEKIMSDVKVLVNQETNPKIQVMLLETTIKLENVRKYYAATN